MKITIDSNYMCALAAVVPKTDARKYLRGVCLGRDNKLVATDGQRMLITKVEV